MKSIVLESLMFTALIGFSGSSAYAQKNDADVNIWMKSPVVVDGHSDEWHEPLNNFNSDTKLAFALGNDDKNLYLVIESLDEVTTGKLIRGGLTLNINTAGKKKDGIKLDFLGMREQPPQPNGQSNDSVAHLHDSNSGAHEAGVKVITVSGFKNIPDGALLLPNDFGIQVAAAFNQRRDYICELEIPLAQLNLTGKEAKGIAYQIKINTAGHFAHNHEGGEKGEAGGMSHGGGMGGGKGGRGGGGMSGAGMGGHGGGMGGGRRGGAGMSANTSEGNREDSKPDFWIKYQLAPAEGTLKEN